MAAERCRGVVVAMLLAAACAPMVRAATASPRRTHSTVPLSLLEFLGRSDPTQDARQADGGRWMVYLSRLNLGKTAPAPRKPAKGKSHTGSARPGKKGGA